MTFTVSCETCNELTDYIAKWAPDKCIIQQARGIQVSDEEMGNYEDAVTIWIKHWSSHNSEGKIYSD